METLIEAIRTAILPDATGEARHQGALACRTILTALDAKPGEPIATVTAEQAASPPEIAAAIGALRGVPVEQLLDLAIARLRAALPLDATRVEMASPAVRFQIVPVPPVQR